MRLRELLYVAALQRAVGRLPSSQISDRPGRLHAERGDVGEALEDDSYQVGPQHLQVRGQGAALVAVGSAWSGHKARRLVEDDVDY